VDTRAKAVEAAVFTIATGRKVYLDMAFALARSYRRWHSETDPKFYIATDSQIECPVDLQALDIIRVQPGALGSGFSSKLFLDRLAPARQSLFVDADCLCVGSLASAFERFRGRAVSVIGRNVGCGEWFGDVGAICRQFGVPSVPRFNGGVYYVEPGERCSAVYETARSLHQRYDEIGFKRLRGSENDEVLMALAMALHRQEPIAERGDIMNSLLAGPGGLEIDVLRGRALLRNPADHPKHNDWYEMEELRPRIVHFLGMDCRAYPYGREIARLKLVDEHGWPAWLARFWVGLSYSAPRRVLTMVKDLLRPIWHKILGPRPVRYGR